MNGKAHPSLEHEWKELSQVELPRKFESAQMQRCRFGHPKNIEIQSRVVSMMYVIKTPSKASVSTVQCMDQC